jgi:hypothetical protein
MRVLLISANRETMNMKTLPLGLAYVAGAVARAGHEVEWLDLMEPEDWTAELADQARQMGLVPPDDDLPRPRFYLEPDLAGDLPEIVARRAEGRRNWII